MKWYKLISLKKKLCITLLLHPREDETDPIMLLQFKEKDILEERRDGP